MRISLFYCYFHGDKNFIEPYNRQLQQSLVDEPLAHKNERTVNKARSILIDYRRELSKLSVPMLQKVST